MQVASTYMSQDIKLVDEWSKLVFFSSTKSCQNTIENKILMK
jgi:hypothetical protein